MTAEEIYKNFFDSFPRHGVYLADDWKEKIKELAIDFAKYHVFNALEAVCDKAFLSSINYDVEEPQEKGNLGKSKQINYKNEYICINTDSVINSYSLENIK